MPDLIHFLHHEATTKFAITPGLENNTVFQNNVHVHVVIKKNETQRLTLHQGSPKERM